MKKLIQNEFKGWKSWEITWLVLACAVITGLSVYWGDNLMGIISSTTGVACVICTGKGKLSAYVFGLINSVLYAIISYRAALYGETMLNAVYYVPMQFYGFYVWSRNMNRETTEVKKKHMSLQGRIIALSALGVGTIGYGFILKAIGDAMPFVDSFTTVSSVIAMIISVRMFSEQWWLWIAVDVFTVFMWAVAFMNGNESVATLLMWIVYLGNAIIMCVKWEKEIKINKGEKNEI